MSGALRDPLEPWSFDPHRVWREVAGAVGPDSSGQFSAMVSFAGREGTGRDENRFKALAMAFEMVAQQLREESERV